MIFVDGLYNHPGKGYWCHMWCDGPLDDLHVFAARIGLKRAYFQDRPGLPHYDLMPSKRQKALNFGAREMSLKYWLKNHVFT